MPNFNLIKDVNFYSSIFANLLLVRSNSSIFMSFKFSKFEIWLFFKLSVFKFFKNCKFSIFKILFSAKFTTSSCFKLSSERILSIQLWERSKYLRLSSDLMLIRFEISLILLFERSRLIKWGKETKFSIFEIQLCLKINSLICSSPSNRGMCVKCRELRLKMSGFLSRSAGLRYTMMMLGI